MWRPLLVIMYYYMCFLPNACYFPAGRNLKFECGLGGMTQFTTCKAIPRPLAAYIGYQIITMSLHTASQSIYHSNTVAGYPYQLKLHYSSIVMLYFQCFPSIILPRFTRYGLHSQQQIITHKVLQLVSVVPPAPLLRDTPESRNSTLIIRKRLVPNFNLDN